MSKPLPKTRRKEALGKRAAAYSDAKVESGDWPTRRDALTWAYEDGYRAAMRDLRYALTHPDPLYVCHDEATANAAREFARPLK